MQVRAVIRGTSSTSASLVGAPTGIFVGTFLLALAAGFGLTRIDASQDALLLAAIGVTLFSPIAVRVVQRRFDPFEPVVLFVGAFGVMFVVRPLAMLADGDLVYERSSSAIAVDETFSEMLVLALVGAIGFVLAYSLPVGRRLAVGLRAPNTAIRSGRIVTVALVTAVVALALTALFLIGSGVSLELLLAGRNTELTRVFRSSSAYLAHAPFLLVPSALLLFMVVRMGGRKTVLIPACAVTVLLLVFSVPLGSRMLLLPFLGGALVWAYISRGSRPGAITLTCFVLIALFTSTVLLHSRTSTVTTDPTLREAVTSTLRHPSAMLTPLTHGSDAEMAPALAAALNVVPEEIGFRHGRATVGDLATRPVPSQLWAEKPLSPREAIIAHVWPVDYVHQVANPEFSVLFYFYLDLALIGVIGGMAIYGLIARTIYEYFQAHADNVVVCLLYSIALPFVVIALRDSPVDTLVRSTYVLTPVLIVLWLAASPRRHTRVKHSLGSHT